MSAMEGFLSTFMCMGCGGRILSSIYEDAKCVFI